MQEKEKCEKVLRVFEDYLQKSPVPEVFWSEKKQCYYYVRHYEKDLDDFYKVETAENLCGLLLDEIDMDVYMELKLDKQTGDGKMTPKGKEIALKRMDPYLNQLPEYAHLANEIYEE